MSYDTPPELPECPHCKGEGKVIMIDTVDEVDTPEYEDCDVCGGQGTVSELVLKHYIKEHNADDDRD